MSGKKKSGKQDKALKTIVLLTAILELVNTLWEILKKIIE